MILGSQFSRCKVKSLLFSKHWRWCICLGPIHTGCGMRRTMRCKKMGPVDVNGGCPHCTQAISKEKRSNLPTRRIPRPVWIGPQGVCCIQHNTNWTTDNKLEICELEPAQVYLVLSNVFFFLSKAMFCLSMAGHYMMPRWGYSEHSPNAWL